MSAPPTTQNVRGPRIGFGRSSEVFLYGSNEVLKLYRVPWEPAAVENEFEATRLAWTLGLPVPTPVMIIEEDGRAGIVFERLHGRPMLNHYARRPIGFLLALRHMASLQRDIHAHTAPQLSSQQEMLRDQIAGARVSDEVKQAALATLEQLPDGSTLCHGDLHPENIVYTPSGLRITDWQKARAGHPAADVARTALILRYGRLNLGRIGRFLPLDAIRQFLAFLYVWRYAQLSGMSQTDIAAWRLPLMVSRLFGQVAENEDVVRGEAERLARQMQQDRTSVRNASASALMGTLTYLSDGPGDLVAGLLT